MSKRSKKSKINRNKSFIGLDNRSSDLKRIYPATPSQQEVLNAFEDGHHLFLHGVAGTGKTFVSLYLALRELMSSRSMYREIQIIRSVVPTRDMGFLPGTEKQKIESYDAVKHNYQEVLKSKNLKNCPKYWGGFSFKPYYFEFWEGNKNRINKREVYVNTNGCWKHSFLQP